MQFNLHCSPQGDLRLLSPLYLPHTQARARTGPALHIPGFPLPGADSVYLPDRPLKFALGQAPDPFAKLARWVVTSDLFLSGNEVFNETGPVQCLSNCMVSLCLYFHPLHVG